jgi:hypothetical protein
MRIQGLAPLLIGLSIAAVSVGCGRSSSTTTDPTSPPSSAPGTLVKQPLGSSSAGAAASARPTPAR